MGKGKAGAKRKDGRRTAGGRLSRIQAPDRGSDRTQEARAAFAPFQGGKAWQQVFDPIGRAWAVGLLENDRVDPAVLRDVGREYADHYWVYYPSPKAVACYGGREPRATVSADRDGQGEYFQFLDGALTRAGRKGRDAVVSLVIDQHHFPDENPAWLHRLINERLIQAKRPAVGQLPVDADRALMVDALCGLLALAGKG